MGLEICETYSSQEKILNDISDQWVDGRLESLCYLMELKRSFIELPYTNVVVKNISNRVAQ